MLVLPIPKLAQGGIIEETMQFEELEEEIEIPIIPKTIKKKRFIKLLMSMGHQRNEANKMHEEYMKKHKTRTMLELLLFEAFYNTKIEEIIDKNSIIRGGNK